MGKVTQSQTEPYEVFRISGGSYEQCATNCFLYFFHNETIQLSLNTRLFNKPNFCRNSKGIQFSLLVFDIFSIFDFLRFSSFFFYFNPFQIKT
jgi:hypothetical protein